MRQVELTGSQREALSLLAQSELPVRISMDPGCVAPNIANVLTKRGLATVSGGMSKRTITITDAGRAEADAGGAPSVERHDVEAMAQAMYEADKFSNTDEHDQPYEAGTWPEWDELNETRKAFVRARAQMLLRRYHELLRAKREGPG